MLRFCALLPRHRGNMAGDMGTHCASERSLQLLCGTLEECGGAGRRLGPQSRKEVMKNRTGGRRRGCRRYKEKKTNSRSNLKTDWIGGWTASSMMPRFLSSLAVGVGCLSPRWGTWEEDQIWGPLTLPAFTVMLMSVSLSFLQLICTLPASSWAGTCPSSLSLLLTQHHVGPREALACVCGMDK